ncbi:hypothetical protein L1887_38188 [Cichorium endivia]|nr:hypothetical protein L1887_38188 [Cichorium endivia]
MSMSLKEFDYIRPSEAKMEKITHKQDLNLKATELRLGLPGSESPERNTINGGGMAALKILVSGAKRGFSDTIKTSSGTWGFPDNGGSEVDFVKNGALFSSSSSPRIDNKNPNSVKEAVVSSSTKNYLHDKHSQIASINGQDSVAASKGQVVGWPPIRSFRKNSMATKQTKNDVEMGSNCVYVKVSMDGAPYLRKVDLKIYSSYLDLSSALEKMFSSFTLGLSESQMDLLNGSEYVLTYEDKDGDLMLVGDVPWDMFTASCKRMRIMKSSDASCLAPRAMAKGSGRH